MKYTHPVRASAEAKFDSSAPVRGRVHYVRSLLLTQDKVASYVMLVRAKNSDWFVDLLNFETTVVRSLLDAGKWDRVHMADALECGQISLLCYEIPRVDWRYYLAISYVSAFLYNSSFRVSLSSRS